MNASRTIDYWGIVTRSARIAWTHKFLWFFGFFAASGGGGGGNYSSIGERGAQQIRDFFLAHLEILVLLIIGIVVVWLIFLVLNVISKGALLSCISRADRGEPIRFEDGWNEGIKHFWGVLGIGLLGVLIFLVVSFFCVMAVALPMVGGAAGIAVGIFIAAVLFVPYVAAMFLLTFTIIYAEREYVIAGGSVSDALATGWSMTRAYFLQTLLMWLVALGSAIAFFIAIVISLLAIAVPFIIIGVASPVVGLILGIPVGIVFLVLTTAAYSTYDHSLWTLLYSDLKRDPETVPASGGEAGSSGPPTAPAPSSPSALLGAGPESETADRPYDGREYRPETERDE